MFSTLSLLLRQTLVFGKTAASDEEEDWGRMTPGTLKRKREAEADEARKDGRRDAVMDEEAEDTSVQVDRWALVVHGEADFLCYSLPALQTCCSLRCLAC